MHQGMYHINQITALGYYLALIRSQHWDILAPIRVLFIMPIMHEIRNTMCCNGINPTLTHTKSDRYSST